MKLYDNPWNFDQPEGDVKLVPSGVNDGNYGLILISQLAESPRARPATLAQTEQNRTEQNRTGPMMILLLLLLLLLLPFNNEQQK
ncbi:hypothetical protein M0804_008800 [Polistes exclamans]|nr:hypothetical protein M0804_008800 [Polistes exclamans]